MVPYTKFNKYCWYNLAKFKSLAWLWFLNLTPWINGLVGLLDHHQTIIETNRSTWSTRAISNLGSIGSLALLALFTIFVIKHLIMKITKLALGSTGWLALFAMFVVTIKHQIIRITNLESTDWSVPFALFAMFVVMIKHQIVRITNLESTGWSALCQRVSQLTRSNSEVFFVDLLRNML